ncbi:MAG: endonuclease/exonuclease/phosphatase family protein [Clostridia bacterium]|nr:endonuclease/exonuclease/phosphatase family protein [Clostridia bacterium]
MKNLLKIVCQNVRCCNDPGGNSIAERVPRMKEVLEQYDPDVIGFQEVSKRWVPYLMADYGEKYDYRIDFRAEKSKEAVPIFWKRDKFTCLASGRFWLSDTPEQESMGWGAKYYRIVTWVKLQIKATGKIFLFYNTHYDWNDEFHQKSAALIAERAAEQGGFSDYAVFCTADFNMGRKSVGYAAMLEHFADANIHDDLTHSYNSYGKRSGLGDFIFMTPAHAIPLHYNVMTEMPGGGYPSDHFGLYAEVMLKPEMKIITPPDGHYFFGYYDLQPFDSTGRYHLCHKAPFEDHIPEKDDICEIGAIDLETNTFIKYAETTSWNFQQGALLRWYRDDDHILFNTAEGCCILNIKTGEKRLLPLPIADVSRDGKWGISVNFQRIFDFRPGYGYAGKKDPHFNENAPETDGVFLMDMETGDYRLIASYPQLRDTRYEPPLSDCKLLVNHINFNPAGTHFVMLFRNFGEGKKWATQLISGDLQGNLKCLGNWGMFSHYGWKNNAELLIFSKQNDQKGLYLFNIHTGEYALLDAPHPEQDIHCLYSPCGRFISGDGYPSKEDLCRDLHFIDTVNKTDTVIARSLAFEYSKEKVEFRTDLHARFDPAGNRISYDSNHPGQRCICILEL